jgi:F-type H+-transporting ATPase subunit epsilon
VEDNKLFNLKVVTPDRIFYDGMVEMVELKTTEGDIGILKGHIPLTAVVAPGALIIKEASETKEAALIDGIVRILGDSVTVLAQSCEWPEEIDVNRANEAKIRAERRLSGQEGEVNFQRAELALKRSITRLEVADKYK